MYLLEMNHSKAMGLGAMVLLLVAAVVLLPIIVRYIDKKEYTYISGFKDLDEADMRVQDVPSVMKSDSYRPDQNTDYMCSSPNGSGESCPEGTFCDGASQQCVQSYVGGDMEQVKGYFS